MLEESSLINIYGLLKTSNDKDKKNEEHVIEETGIGIVGGETHQIN